MKRYSLIIVTALLMLLFVGCATKNQASKVSKSLQASAGKGDLGKVKAEINGGENINSKDSAGQTALMYASESGMLDVVKYLMESGADVNAQSVVKTTALFYASANNRIAVMKYLLEHGAEIDATTSLNDTALIWATEKGHLEAVNLLLEKNATTKIRNSKGNTALDIAKELNRKNIEFIILEAGKKEDIQIAADQIKNIQIAADQKKAAIQMEKNTISKKFTEAQRSGKNALFNFIERYPGSEFVSEAQRSIARIDEIEKSMETKKINKNFKIGITLEQLINIFGFPQDNALVIGGKGTMNVLGRTATWVDCEDSLKDLPYCGAVNITTNRKEVVIDVSTGATFYAQ